MHIYNTHTRHLLLPQPLLLFTARRNDLDSYHYASGTLSNGYGLTKINNDLSTKMAIFPAIWPILKYIIHHKMVYSKSIEKPYRMRRNFHG